MNDPPFEELQVIDGRFKDDIAKAFCLRRAWRGGQPTLEQIQVIEAALSGKQTQGHGISLKKGGNM